MPLLWVKFLQSANTGISTFDTSNSSIAEKMPSREFYPYVFVLELITITI